MIITDEEIRRQCNGLMQSLSDRKARAEKRAQGYRDQGQFEHAMICDTEVSTIETCIISAGVYLQEFLEPPDADQAECDSISTTY